MPGNQGMASGVECQGGAESACARARLGVEGWAEPGPLFAVPTADEDTSLRGEESTPCDHGTPLWVDTERRCLIGGEASVGLVPQDVPVASVVMGHEDVAARTRLGSFDPGDIRIASTIYLD